MTLRFLVDEMFPAAVCVLKSRLPVQGMAVALAELLDAWADATPQPYVGLHRP